MKSGKIKFFAFLIGAVFLLNVVFQIYRDPLELLRILPITSTKTVNQTWAAYQDDFSEYSTPLIPAEFIAAIAQTESSGDAWAQPGWDLKMSPQWHQVLSPASTAFGLMQITTPTLHSILRLCRIGAVINTRHKDFCKSGFHSRLSPKSSIAMSAIHLDYSLRKILSGRKVSPRRALELTSVIHLCGPGFARNYAKSDRYRSKERYCGSHSVARYIKRVFRNHSRLTKNIL